LTERRRKDSSSRGLLKQKASLKKKNLQNDLIVEVLIGGFNKLIENEVKKIDDKTVTLD